MWIVTRDHLDNKDVKVCSVDYKDELRPFLTEEFRMYDDDDNLYYSGFSDDGDTEDAFAPLDDYGMPNAGCTYIQYKNLEGEWETL